MSVLSENNRLSHTPVGGGKIEVVDVQAELR